MSATLPPLDYGYDALEPHINQEIMTLHHTKHHQAYVNNLNAAEKNYASATTPSQKIGLQAAIRFNGGGHINHTLFWKNLSPIPAKGGKGGVLNDGPLKAAIDKDFGSVDKLKEELNAQTAAIQGSGWGWLGYNTKSKRLEVLTTPNQDPVLAPYVVLIGIDIWEHAFYLQYKNDKVTYLKEIWNVINFEEAEKRFVEASK
ncbi:hypothetical protein M407DRAFT_243082 [Tulasnella calospora MUT 4182]|uniref:Superoxide dismutase n=1 Tax=Tulasnella calospora MUT 4182 TaxID=1051891 RepID=A0A0C3QMY6_9AGAM|nr:hypothetical protein M407DRAFT_243082 [Tulasnella calospora MUT 4182]